MTTPSAEFSSPLFQEGEDPARGRQVYHPLDERLLSSQLSSVGHVRTGRPVNELNSPMSNVRENPRRDSSRLSLIIEWRFRRNLSCSRRQTNHQLLHAKLLKQNWDPCEVHEKSTSRMEELKRFQGSTFDTIARRKLVEDRDTILELTGRMQELQNEIKLHE